MKALSLYALDAYGVISSYILNVSTVFGPDNWILINYLVFKYNMCLLFKFIYSGEMYSETTCGIPFRFCGSLDIQPRIAVNKYWRYIGTSLELYNVEI